MNQKTFVEIRSLLSKALQLPEAEILENSNLEDLGVDSFRRIEIGIDLELEYDLLIPDQHIFEDYQINTVADVVEFVDEHRCDIR